MEWAFTIEGQGTNEAEFVHVPDGTSPPSVGEKFVINGPKLKGVYYVQSREFVAQFPSIYAGDLAFSWAFVLSPKL